MPRAMTLRSTALRDRHIAGMDAQDFFAPADIRVRHHDLTVEAAGTQQGRIEHVGTVGRRDQDDAFIGFEASISTSN